MKYYSVRVGKIPGIYKTWDEAKIQVNGFAGAKYKSFTTEREAIEFMGEINVYSNDLSNSEKVLEPKVTRNTKTISPSQTLSSLGTFVFTDGSCINSFGGYGIVIIENGKCMCKISGSVPFEKATNNIAELYAIKIALINTEGDITIYTDSQYSIGVITGSMKASKNLELIRDIKKLINGRQINFLHVFGHNGDEYNELADKLADEGRLE